MKQVNLYVWLVLSALVVLVGMMLISVVTSAMAEGMVEFHPCQAKTCKAVDAATMESIGAGDTFYMLPSHVVSVSSLPGCAECSKLVTRGGKTVYVLMSPAAAACALYGGDRCTSRAGK